ncbi:MAG: hypothetical protein ABSH51_27205 [Solirubrobacteraceae bacterium]|jgi:hypothetical protein
MSTITDASTLQTPGRSPRRGRRKLAIGRLAAAVSASALAAGALAGTAVAATSPPNVSGNYAFQKLGDNKDVTFNQLLGINNEGVIAGYFGSGMTKSHPNKGYVLNKPYGQNDFANENVPGSAQTQVTGINNDGVTVGFSVDGAGANSGFYHANGTFHTVDFPAANNASPKFDQVLGVNDAGIAVGFYNDAKGAPHGFTYNIAKSTYHAVTVSGDTGVTAAAINNLGDIAGIATNASGATEGFLLRSDGKVVHLNFPGAKTTQAFGVNDGDEVVGDYTMGSGSTATTDGFVWAPGFGFQTVDDPDGVGATTINGVNDRGTLVGFYTDGSGNTDGLLAKSVLGS